MATAAMTVWVPHAATPRCSETFHEKERMARKGEGRVHVKERRKGKGLYEMGRRGEGMGLWMEVCFMRGRV